MDRKHAITRAGIRYGGERMKQILAYELQERIIHHINTKFISHLFMLVGVSAYLLSVSSVQI